MRQPIIGYQVAERPSKGSDSVVLESVDGFADCSFEVEDSAYAGDLRWPRATSGAEFSSWCIHLTSTPEAEGRLDARGLAHALLAEPRAEFVAADAAWRVEEVKD
jgi:hypothetical protein